MSEQDHFCAKVSLARQEPMGASAPGPFRHWILAQDCGPWGPKAPNALGLLDPETREAWEQIGKMSGVRRLYLRRPKMAPTMPQAPRRFWIAEQGPQGGRVYSLSERPLRAFVQEIQSQGIQAVAAQGQEMENLWLVCTHGRRDRCCSLMGTGVFAELNRHLPDAEIWQCSHLGGHRFAATALHLPSGYVWGRLSREDAAALSAMRGRGSLALPEKLRGHSGLHRRAQLVDLALRRRSGDWGGPVHDALWQMDPDAQSMELPGEAHLVLRPGPSALVYGSCADPEPKPRPSWEVQWVDVNS